MALWDYRIKHILKASSDSSPEAKNKLVNFTCSYNEFHFQQHIQGDECWQRERLQVVIMTHPTPHQNIFLFCSLSPSPPFFLSQKDAIFLQSTLPFPTSIVTITNCQFLRSYVPTGKTLVVPWKDLKDIKWTFCTAAFALGFRSSNRDLANTEILPNTGQLMSQISYLSGSRSLWWGVLGLGLLQHGWFTDV